MSLVLGILFRTAFLMSIMPARNCGRIGNSDKNAKVRHGAGLRDCGEIVLLDYLKIYSKPLTLLIGQKRGFFPNKINGL